MTEYIVKLTYQDGGAAQKAQRDADKIRGALGPLENLGGRRRGIDPATAFLREREKAYRQQQRADANYTKFWEGEIAKRERAQQKETASLAREEAKRNRIRDADKIRGALGPLENLGGRRRGIDPATAFLREREKAYRQQQRADANYTKFWEGEIAKRERAQQKETASLAREEAKRNRIADQAAALRAKAHERAAHKSYFGGEKSVGDLLRKRAGSRASGLATGAADALLSAPGQIVTGALGAVGSVAAGTATIAYNLGKAAIAAQAMREDSVEGFTAIFGSSSEANRLFDVARVAAKQTKFDTKEVVRDFNTIAAAGFKSDQIERIYWTSADIGSARGGGRQQSYLNALAKINASPQASFGSVQQAALAGPGIGNVFNELSKRLGINQTLSRKDWMKKFRDGGVSGSVALESVIGATNSLYNKKTGQAGEYAKGQGDTTWSGVISNIKNGLGDVLNMKLPADHSLNKFKILLQSIGSTGGLFDETTQRGQRFARLISNVVEDIFKPFGGITLSNANNLIDKLLDGAESLEQRFRSVMTTIKDSVGDFMGNAKASLLDLAAEIGAAIGKGMYLAIQRGVNSLPVIGSGLSDSAAAAQAQKGLGVGAFYSKASTKGVASTAVGSAIFAPGTIGGSLYDALGGQREVPSMASGGVVPGPPGAPVMVQMHGGEVVPGLRGEYMGAAMAKYGRGGGLTVNIYQTITGGGDPVQTAQYSNQMIEATMDRYVGRLAAQGIG